MDDAGGATNPLDGITVLTEPAAELLNERQQIDYRQHREQCLEWLVTFGKDPQTVDGYARTTVKARAHRMDQFYRFVWQELVDGYTANVTHEHADAWLKNLAKQEYSNAHRENCQKALQMLFKWREHEHGFDEWDPEIRFSRTGSATTRVSLSVAAFLIL